MDSFWGRMQTELLNRRRWNTRLELANDLRISGDLPQPAATTQRVGDAHPDRVRDASPKDPAGMTANQVNSTEVGPHQLSIKPRRVHLDHLRDHLRGPADRSPPGPRPSHPPADHGPLLTSAPWWGGCPAGRPPAWRRLRPPVVLRLLVPGRVEDLGEAHVLLRDAVICGISSPSESVRQHPASSSSRRGFRQVSQMRCTASVLPA